MTISIAPSLRRIALLVLIVLASTAFGVTVAGPASAGTTPAQDEYRMLTLVNQERKARGLAPMVSDPAFADTARSWSGYLASQGRLSHDSRLKQVADRIEPNWRLVAENVGYAGSVDRVHHLLMNSTGHRNNILSSSTNRIGIGIVHSGGSVWVTQRFLQGPAISGRTGLETCGGPVAGGGGVASADLDGDGDDDLLVHGPGGAPDAVLRGSAHRRFATTTTAIQGSYLPLPGDFTGSGEDMVLFYSPGSAADYISEWTGSKFSSVQLRINGHYTPAVGDFDGDGRDDIIWYAAGSHPDYIWYGTSTVGKFIDQRITVNGKYCLIVADLDGNGQDDLTWYAPGRSADYLHMRTGARSYKSVRVTINGTYRPASGDFDADGQDDILWHAPGTAADYLWYGKTGFGDYESVRTTANGNYQPVTGDFDADGNDDIVWSDGSDAAGAPIWYGENRRGKFEDGRV